MKVLYVLLGGSVGALCRYGINTLTRHFYGDRFPWGTLIVNLVGCFLIGLIFALGNERGVVSPSFRLFFVTGFLGALTTFSSYAMETMRFASDGIQPALVTNILANNVGGLVLVMIGMRVGRSL